MEKQFNTTITMQCNYCRKISEYSPLRLGRICGQCRQGKWLPHKEIKMKDQTGKEMTREFAPNKRNPNDKYKIKVVEKKSDYEVTQEPGTNRPIVTKKKKD